MGLAVSTARLYMECGGSNGAKHATELLNAIKQEIGSEEFKKNYNVYQQACYLLGNDSNSTVQDVKNMVNTANNMQKQWGKDAATTIQTAKRTIFKYTQKYNVKDFPAEKMEYLVGIAGEWGFITPNGYSSFDEFAEDVVAKYAEGQTTEGDESDTTNVDSGTTQTLVDDGIEKAVDTFSRDNDTDSTQKTIDENIEKAINTFSNDKISLKGKLKLPNNAYPRFKFN